MRDYNGFEMKGRLYTYALNINEAADNGPAIYGTVTLEVDSQGTQAAIQFYATPRYKSSGKVNRTYTMLEEMLNGEYPSVKDNPEVEPAWFGATGTIDTSYFIGNREPAKSPEEMATSMRLRGSFLNPNTKKEFFNKWKLDLLVTGVTEIDADPEKGFERHARILGYSVDSYRERLANVTFEARSDAAIDFMLSLTCSAKEPMFFPAWGCMKRVTASRVTKNLIAGGEDDVVESGRERWVLTGLGNAYAFGDESVMSLETYEQFRKGLADFKAQRFADLQEDKPANQNLAF